MNEICGFNVDKNMIKTSLFMFLKEILLYC